jgi:hypothetical protein
MLDLVRSGPQVLSLVFDCDFKRAEEILLKWGEQSDVSPERAFWAADAHVRIAIVNSAAHGYGRGETRVYQSGSSFERLLCMLLSERDGARTVACKPWPGCIFFRLIGDINSGIGRIKEDFNGSFADKGLMFSGSVDENSTVVYFTDKPLNCGVPDQFVQDTALVIDVPKDRLITLLRLRQCEYLGDARGTPDWNCMEVQIGDIRRCFSVHRKRVWEAVQGLAVGLVLEEYWRRERTLMRRETDVYVLKLFTPFDPESIKKILCALEYDDSGERIADIDLFFNGEKIKWDALRKDDTYVSRKELGVSVRLKMLGALDPYSRKRMRKLDEELNMAASGA